MIAQHDAMAKPLQKHACQQALQTIRGIVRTQAKRLCWRRHPQTTIEGRLPGLGACLQAIGANAPQVICFDRPDKRRNRTCKLPRKLWTANMAAATTDTEGMGRRQNGATERKPGEFPAQAKSIRTRMAGLGEAVVTTNRPDTYSVHEWSPEANECG